MSATEEHTIAHPNETKPVDPAAAAKTYAVDTTTTAFVATKATRKMAIVIKDPEYLSAEPSTSAAANETPPATLRQDMEGSTFHDFKQKNVLKTDIH
jgi:hypothetical protein